MNASTPTFGPGGNGDWFYAEGNKSTTQSPAWLKEKQLDAFEYEAGNGISAGEASLRTVGEQARLHGILLSLHAPYYISLSGADEEKRLKSITYIQKSLWAAELLGADTIVIHSGSAGKLTREEAMRLSCDTLSRVAEAVGDAPCARLGIETMGKVNQLGTLDEVLALCEVDPRITPCIDFGHLYARSCGVQFADATAAADYAALLDTLAARLGDDRAVHFHAHFSRIAYTKGGEKCHLTFADTAFGPPHAPLLALLKERHLAPTIICESAGTQAEDAAALAQGYAAL